jgi:hypothetical protein
MQSHKKTSDPHQWLSIIKNRTMLREQGLEDGDTTFLTNTTMFPGTIYRTTLIPGLTAPRCCTNGSSNQHLSPAALGYWTMNFLGDLGVNQSALYRKSGNFTIKLVTGIANLYKSLQYKSNNILYFSKRLMI